MLVEELGEEALEQYNLVRENVGLLNLTDRGKIEVVGSDRITFLHAMISNDVLELPELCGRYGLLLTARGKMTADFFYYKLPEVLLIDVADVLLPVMQDTLQRYIIMDAVEINNASTKMAHLSLQGPKTQDLVKKLFGGGIPSTCYGIKKVEWDGKALWMVAKNDLAEIGCELIMPVVTVDSLHKAILEEGASLGLVEISQKTRNILRMESCIPWYGQDMDENRYPIEARLEAAISLTKGCYLGQEVVSKAVHVGGVSNLLMGLKLAESTIPDEGAQVFNNQGRQIGSITSAVFSPRCGCPIAFAYIKSKFATPGDICQIETVSGEMTTATIVDNFL